MKTYKIQYKDKVGNYIILADNEGEEYELFTLSNARTIAGVYSAYVENFAIVKQDWKIVDSSGVYYDVP